MKFYPLLPGMQTADLTEEYRASREIGSIRIGREHFFFRLRLKVYYIPYGRIRRCYRRVLLVPATVCCGRGELQVENLVLGHKGRKRTDAGTAVPNTGMYFCSAGGRREQMTLEEALKRVLRSFQTYYNIDLENPAEPFAAEARFLSHDTQYFLMKAARIAESDSREYVFFALEDQLDADRFEQLDAAAWSTGMARVEPAAGHRSTDVILVILTNHLDEDAMQRIRSRKHYQSYRFGLRGWSNYRLIAMEIPTGREAHNRLGRDLPRLLSNVRQSD